MRWIWDDAKSEWTKAERAFDFAFVVRMFDGPVRLFPADRNGERRWQAVGMIDGLHYSVIYTKRGTGAEKVRRIISARRARHNERQAYDRR